MFDVAPDGWGYVIRRKGQRQIFAYKGLVIFDDYAAARENFDKANRSGPAEGWAGHQHLLWVVAASSRGAVPSRLLKGGGNPRRLAETDYRALLDMYHKPAATKGGNLDLP